MKIAMEKMLTLYYLSNKMNKIIIGIFFIFMAILVFSEVACTRHDRNNFKTTGTQANQENQTGNPLAVKNYHGFVRILPCSAGL
jgi:hypothetical protein